MAEKTKKQLTKAEFVKLVKETGGYETEKQAANCVNAFIEAVSQSLRAGNGVSLLNFGTFEIKDDPARECRNIATGEKMKVEARKRVRLKLSKKLKDLVV